MTFKQYLLHFEAILTADHPSAPYDQPDYFNYAKLNFARMSRWQKHAVPSEEVIKTIGAIKTYQRWVIITEPWCGDAAHIIPFINIIATLNPLITVDYQLRDSAPFLINEHLTNGNKSIPKLIVQDQEGRSLASWGPRPIACQVLYDQLKADHVDLKL